MINTIRFFFYFFKVVVFHKDVRNHLKLGDFAMEAAPEDLFANLLKKNPYLRDVTDKRYMGEFPIPGQDEGAFAPGTLGYAYLEFLQKNKITQYSQVVAENRGYSSNNDYLKERVRYLRDLLRLILNLGSTYEDEAALNAFLFAQLPSPLPAAVIAGVILHGVFLDPSTLKPIFSKVVQAYRCGESSKNFLTIKWETMWHMSLDEARQQLVPNTATEAALLRFSSIN